MTASGSDRSLDEPPGHPGHLGFVVVTAFAPGGRVLYSAAAEGVVIARDVANGAVVDRSAVHDGPITALRISPDGVRLVTASLDGTAAVWDVPGRRLLHRLRGHRGGVHALAWSAGLIATGGFDATIRLWDASGGAPQRTLAGHDDTVTDLAFVPGGRLVSASRDCTVRTWDVETGMPVRTLEGHSRWVTRLAPVAGGERVLSAGEDGRCVLWDLAVGAPVWDETLDATLPIWGLAVARDGTFAVTGGAGPALRRELASGARRVLGPETGSRRGIAISPDGAHAALGGDDGSVLLYDLQAERAEWTAAGASEGYLNATVDASGETVAVGRFDGAIDVLGPGERRRRLDGAHAFMAYSLCRLGADRFASGGFDGAVRLWDFATATPLARFEHGGPIFSLAASADGGVLLSAGGDTLRLWDARTGAPRFVRERTGSGAHTVADLSGDGGVIVSAGEDDAVHVWRPDGSVAARLSHACGQISALRLLPDGRRAALADARGRVWLMTLDTGAGELLHDAHEDWIRGLHVTADGRFVASASQNGICRVYDRSTRRLLPPQGDDGPIAAVAVGPSDRIVTVSAAGAVRSQEASAGTAGTT